MKAKIALLLLLTASAACMGTACQKQDGIKAKSYSRDGLLGLSDVNPNMPMSPTYHNYRADTQLMKDTLQPIPNITGSTINMNGPIATVRIKVRPDLTDEQVAAVQKEASEKLTHAMPRYTVKVSVSR
ncbi:hypothetical protein ACFQ88_28260 [Paenibacillus sp. NPDC056579]|uniref:hypothetical protein n=1 Tax=unclassified Paenibacillus TaxID=185978 RepID=UPI001EF99609|nr:hypothetical protein [Paenibacillus sp. H1-7]ULL13279.1 hypothetical protein DVH26_01550 [Paenibacillus sp. H1-7]